MIDDKHDIIIATRYRVISTAKEMLGIPEDKNLTKRMHYRLIQACTKCERAGELLTSKQVIASIVEMVELIDWVDNHHTKC